MDTLHRVDDLDKARILAASMERDGWQGAPLVTDGNQLITGVHRYHAWTELCERPAFEIPTVDIRDVFAEADLDYDTIMAEMIDSGLDWYIALVEAVRDLPADIANRYGIDVE